MTSPTNLPTHGFYDLDELCGALNRIVYDDFDKPLAWDHRFPRNHFNMVAFSALPLFAGPSHLDSPVELSEAYSWDASRMIVKDQYDASKFRIVDRPDWIKPRPPLGEVVTLPTSHTAIVIQWYGGKRCYLDMTREQAVAEWQREEGVTYEPTFAYELTFTDRFDV